MLPAAMRMRAKDDFTATVRRGRRCGQPRLVVHLLLPEPSSDQAPDLQERARSAAADSYPQGLSAVVDSTQVTVDAQVRVGFVVSRQVGSSVVRNRVERRLRHACRDVAARLPRGARMVVRATPASSEASFAELTHDLDRALTRCLDRARGTRGRR